MTTTTPAGAGERLTAQEIADIFGSSIPVAAMNLLANPEPGMTPNEMRDRLKALATTPGGAGERCPTCDLLKDGREGRYCSDAFHLPTSPAPDLSRLEELMEKLKESHCDTVECDHGFLLHRDRCPNQTCLGQDLRDAVSLLSALKAAGEERDAIKAGLSDPNFVHINMLGGGIAKPSLRQMLHLEGEAALATWAKATSLQQENDRLREALGQAERWFQGYADDYKASVLRRDANRQRAQFCRRAALSSQGGDAGSADQQAIAPDSKAALDLGA